MSIESESLIKEAKARLEALEATGVAYHELLADWIANRGAAQAGADVPPTEAMLVLGRFIANAYADLRLLLGQLKTGRIDPVLPEVKEFKVCAGDVVDNQINEWAQKNHARILKLQPVVFNDELKVLVLHAGVENPFYQRVLETQMIEKQFNRIVMRGRLVALTVNNITQEDAREIESCLKKLVGEYTSLDRGANGPAHSSGEGVDAGSDAEPADGPDAASAPDQ